MHRLLEKVWQFMHGRLQWYVLWLLHAKFVVGVAGVVLDDQNRVLLLKHRYRDPNMRWGLPGGYINRGEQLEAALAREVQEEVGLTVQPCQPIQIVSGYKMRLEVFYLVRYVTGQIQVDGTEILDARFFARDEVPTSLPPEHRELIARAFLLQRDA